jgi:hypothetical protein
VVPSAQVGNPAKTECEVQPDFTYEGYEISRTFDNSRGNYEAPYYSSNVNKPPYATMFGARFYCALTLHVSAPIGGHLQVLCSKIYSKVATFVSTDPLGRHTRI